MILGVVHEQYYDEHLHEQYYAVKYDDGDDAQHKGSELETLLLPAASTSEESESQSDAEPMQIFVKALTGKTITLEVYDDARCGWGC